MKRYFKIIGFSIIVGLLVGIFRGFLEEHFGRIPMVGLIGLVVVGVLVFLFIFSYPTVRLRKKLIKIVGDFDKEQDSDKMYNELEVLLSRKTAFFDIQRDKNDAMIRLNMAMAKMFLGDYETAAKIYLTSKPTLKNLALDLYISNYVYCLNKLGEHKKAYEIMTDNMITFKRLFSKFNIGCLASINFIYYVLEKGEEDACGFYLYYARKTMITPYQTQEVEKIEEFLRDRGIYEAVKLKLNEMLADEKE